MSSATLRASLIGAIAARAVREGAKGTVRATFDRSAYLSLDDALICVGATSLGAGPLNVLCEDWFGGRSADGLLKLADVASVEVGVLHAGRTAIPLATAERWHPQPAAGWNGATLARGLAAFDGALPAILPREGLARLLHASEDYDTPVLSAARIAMQHLTRLLHSPSGHIGDTDTERVASLVGMGPGLTPAGDDYLGGALVALSVTTQFQLRDRIWRVLQPQASERTNDVARAHLDAAAEGLGSAALHGLLNAILAGETDKIPAAIESAAAIGHTSGWDTVAGAITVLRTRWVQGNRNSLNHHLP